MTNTNITEAMIRQAKALGAAAFFVGAMRIPARDAKLTPLIAAASKGGGTVLPVLDAWMNGWDRANIGQPCILETYVTALGRYFTVMANSQSATVALHTDGSVRVICHNAANKVWRGAGRVFETIDLALNGYKSRTVKALISAAVAAANES